jgi:hypothetical protein
MEAIFNSAYRRLAGVDPETLLFSKWQKNLYIPLIFCPQSRLSSSKLEYFRVNLYLKISRFYFAFFLL